MPVVRVYGLSIERPEEDLHDFGADLVSVITKLKPLGLNEDAVIVIFPKGMIMCGFVDEIIVFIDGLLVESERGSLIRTELAHRIGLTTRTRFPEANVKCFVQPFDPTQGFWSHGE